NGQAAPNQERNAETADLILSGVSRFGSYDKTLSSGEPGGPCLLGDKISKSRQLKLAQCKTGLEIGLVHMRDRRAPLLRVPPQRHRIRKLAHVTFS
ncbi:MAG TPA: hypothetical protein P5057_08580, partial [Acidobacteriota bacterium]|nr:hypothetical protein [Acidobacteriota bacterium]